MSEKDYKICSRNSTVCGYPGRDFDWSKFCWDGSAVNVFPCFHRRCKHKHDKAPLPLVDTGLIGEGNEYLHVPYDWAEVGTIYRVRPNESMQAGHRYRGRLVKQTKAVCKPEGWYWRLIYA